MTEVTMEISIKKQLTPGPPPTWLDIQTEEVKVEDSDPGCGAALKGWYSLQHELAKGLFNQDFGPEMEITNVYMDASIKNDLGEEVLNEGNGIFIHYWGQRLFVIEGIKGVAEDLYLYVLNFINQTYR